MPSTSSPVEYLTDDEYLALPVAERALHQARAKEAVRESTGNNDGFWVKTFLAAARVTGRAPWCAAFVTWCVRRAGWSGPLPDNPASTWFWWDWARRTGRLFTPKNPVELRKMVRRGDLFVWNGKNGGHIGFVTAVRPNGLFTTIEGNTNAAGSRDGDGVYDRVRSLGLLQKYPRHGFIRLENDNG